MLAAAGLLAACANSETSSSDFVDNIEPADRLYNKALADLEAGDTKDAQARLKDIDQQHPYSEYSRKAMVMQTFLNYRGKKYDDAVNLGRRFVSLYPADPEAAYAQYLIGMSYFRQIPDVTRDQTVTARAYNAFNAVVERYPESDYVEDSKTKMRIALDQLAGKEMLTGRYYQERREFLAAINRFRRVVERYQKTRHVEEALARLTESYMAIGLANEARNAAAILGHNFPESQWYKDSLALLAKTGDVPEANPDSSISRAFDQPAATGPTPLPTSG